MKKSNIYLIALLSSVTLFIITGAIVSVARGKKVNVENSSVQKMSAYSSLSIQNTNYYVSISSSDDFEFKVYFKEDVQPVEFPYELKGDTLILAEIPAELKDKIKRLQVKLPLEELNIEATSSKFGFDHFNGSTLKLDLDNTEASIYSETALSKLEIKGINHSNFHSRVKCDSLKLDIEKSEFNNWSSTKVVEGKISNKAFVTINNPGDANLSKDSSSKINYYYN
ncbi:hypothetical protein [Flammeovirga aprica]|uniref:Uncharacterized protein n=1 Tax=Flammeovirga aprica JL-4 TaxID=694437 RepID=A0A7X9S1T0_9BACT|nr:hypothetical protein [Flammeovirga aprica]NME72814.1 hypothetical protein [Flammeovirga aprica JL-4]